ncbi:glyoxylase-like metal-dependent hydrolase (beta-lactamase superfamily II) [Curtobacterium flaccumfaciens]|uniref:Glyoxylase-like metal-dependent hydrolase (Beta-lactamase superfamily II) n=1 Tax=Curtobacterium flaccumfaciens TaxID=2035 RepID=A0A4R6DH56_9MICO|nr:MBL fold metallo-hydrolase [Curtobacterium flaccumfaciens]TDN43399.1 glyoxylase-like metal-dependent hydrolase (beta-lactamase superfamily II) [Curtobacterium flaccumfaciens]
MTTVPPPAAPAPEPISPVQAAALRDGVLPPVEEVRPGIWTLAVPFRFGVPDATLVYVVEGADGSLAVIDPGWSGDGSLDELRDGLTSIGRRLEDVSLVAVTHLHADHLGAAAAIRNATGARVAMHRLEVEALGREREDAVANDAEIATWGVPAELRAGVVESWGSGRHIGLGRLVQPYADLLLEDGDELPVAGRSIRALWTPGHTAGHLCFVDEADGLLFTGDHVLPRINPGIGLGGLTTTNPLGDYLASLELLAGMDHLEVCPGHEYRFRGVVSRAQTLARHREERSRHVAAALDALDGPTLFEVAARVPFSGGIETMTGFLLASALTQTAYHAALLGRSDEVRPA